MLAGATRCGWLTCPTGGELTRRGRVTLQKDPKKRPTALALQQHKFVLTAKKPVRAGCRGMPASRAHSRICAQDYLAKNLLEGLPPLGERVKILRERELARRGAAVENDIKSQSECVHVHA